MDLVQIIGMFMRVLCTVLFVVVFFWFIGLGSCTTMDRESDESYLRQLHYGVK